MIHVTTAYEFIMILQMKCFSEEDISQFMVA